MILVRHRDGACLPADGRVWPEGADAVPLLCGQLVTFPWPPVAGRPEDVTCAECRHAAGLPALPLRLPRRIPARG